MNKHFTKTTIGKISTVIMGQSPSSSSYNDEKIGLPFVGGNADIKKKITKPRFFTSEVTKKAFPGDLILTVRAPVGDIVKNKLDICIGRGVCALRVNQDYDCEYIYQYLSHYSYKWIAFEQGSTFSAVNSKDISAFPINTPPLEEQKKIAQILSTWDEAIEEVERLIKKKKKQKIGFFQRYLPMNERAYKNKDWSRKKLREIVNILDSKRVPLNSKQRSEMTGDIPYYGANGIVDYVNDYIFNEKLILLAEDGGHFNEFQTRPIAYIVDGKSWVNNHAHVLSVKEKYDFNFCFYSLQHRNITKYLNGGTRAKLNRGELEKIVMFIPDISIQKRLGDIFSSLDKELELLKIKLNLLKTQKKGLMQRLLTGKVRVN